MFVEIGRGNSFHFKTMYIIQQVIATIKQTLLTIRDF